VNRSRQWPTSPAAASTLPRAGEVDPHIDLDRPPPGPPVMYIAGSGRSGSTMLERVLGEMPGFVNVGELIDLFRRPLDAYSDLLDSRPPQAEVVAISAAAAVARESGPHLHTAHPPRGAGH